MIPRDDEYHNYLPDNDIVLTDFSLNFYYFLYLRIACVNYSGEREKSPREIINRIFPSVSHDL